MHKKKRHLSNILTNYKISSATLLSPSQNNLHLWSSNISCAWCHCQLVLVHIAWCQYKTFFLSFWSCSVFILFVVLVPVEMYGRPTYAREDKGSRMREDRLDSWLLRSRFWGRNWWCKNKWLKDIWCLRRVMIPLFGAEMCFHHVIFCFWETCSTWDGLKINF